MSSQDRVIQLARTTSAPSRPSARWPTSRSGSSPTSRRRGPLRGCHRRAHLDVVDLVAGDMERHRGGQPGACVWLASDEASWVTAETIQLDGGSITT